MGAIKIMTAKSNEDKQDLISSTSTERLSCILNLIGAVLIIIALVFHIVCLATPHWVKLDGKEVAEKLEEVVHEMVSGPEEGNMRSEREKFADQIREAGLVAGIGDLNYGLWKMCVHGDISGFSFDFCGNWASKTKTRSSGMVKSFKAPDWVRGIQAMAICGLLAAAAGAVLAAIHLIGRGKNDRLRPFPIFICITVFLAGAFVLCGDIILAAKYDKLLESMAEEGVEKPPPFFMDLVESFFSLSWGFALDVVASALLFLSGLFYLVGGKAAQADGLV